MSINVTVTGNPISIQKGRMVTASPNHSKKEFERRRLIRLSQVRQQSKNIAEDVRNRVRKQKLKQVEEIEKEGQKKLKQWQARKLLELQNQYHDALKDIGAGHKQANLFEGEVDSFLEKKDRDSKTAQQRGFVANKKMNEEKEIFEETTLEKKKSVREMEDRRAKMISTIKPFSESSKPKNDEKLSMVTDVSGIVTESDSVYDIEEVNIPKANNIRNNYDNPSANGLKYNDPMCVIEEVSEKATGSETEGADTPKFTLSDEELLRELRDQPDTRISDRIRQRSSHQLDQPDICHTLPQHGESSCHSNSNQPPQSVKQTCYAANNKTVIPKTRQNVYVCKCDQNSTVFQSPSPCHGAHPISRKQNPGIYDINRLRCTDFTDEENDPRHNVAQKHYSQQSSSKYVTAPAPPSSPKKSSTLVETRARSTLSEIPTKPKVTLKSVKSPTKDGGLLSQKSTQPSQSKRHSRFLNSHVERITEEYLTTSPEPVTKVDFYEKIRQRDQEALLRGQKALDREKLQREYNELMKKLPALRKLERLYEMNQDKPEYHMTEERLREQERKKQSILDSTYEKLFPDKRPPTITIPVKNASRDDIKDGQAPQKEGSATLNLGAWDAEKKTKKLYTEDEVEAILREGKIPSESRFRTDQLKSVLEKLRKQKEELLKEIQNLPRDSETLEQLLPLSKVGRTRTEQLSTNSSEQINQSVRGSKKTKERIKSTKTLVSVKVGTDSLLQSSSSYETIEEPIKKRTKTTKSVKTASKTSQDSHVSQKSKHIKIKSSSKFSTKSVSPQKVAKKRRPETEFVSSSEQSSTDQKIEKKTVTKQKSPTAHHTSKRQKQTDPSCVLSAIVPVAPSNSLISMTEQIEKPKDEISKPSCTIVSCDCKKDTVSPKSAGLCEIVIKIKDAKSSEVVVKDLNETGSSKVKSVTVEKPRSRHQRLDKTDASRLSEIKKSLKDDCCQDNTNDTKPHSWHEKLCKNISQVSNSSTSYMSPPQLPNKPESESRAPPYFCQLLGKKPQQFNEIITSPPTKLPVENRNVLDEIKRLLNMSRLSIDDLGVSSVSTVATPSQSVIDLESNRGNYSTTRTTSTTHLSINRRTNHQVDISSDGQNRSSFLTVSSDNRTIEPSEIDSKNAEQYPDILAKYAKIADQCSQRISNLSAMIEKVREEKNRMLQAPSILTTNDSTTRYMDLPSPNKPIDEHYSMKESRSSSTTSSEDERNLLDINFSLAEKLKGLTPEEIAKHCSEVDDTVDFDDFQSKSVNNSKAEDDLAKRLKALREPPVMNEGRVLLHKDKLDSRHPSPPQNSGKGDSVEFVPFLLDIPKMPPLVADISNSKHKKPPPSKGILAAKKLTEDYTGPHELSTIPEQDSQTRFESTMKEKSPQTTKDRRSSGEETVPDHAEKQTLETNTKTRTEKLNIKKSGNVPELHKLKISDFEVASHVTTPSVVKSKHLATGKDRLSSNIKELMNNSDNSLVSSNTSGDEKLEMFKIESMLRSIGMDWAISTLRKTQEALALTSSSSSLDMRSAATIKELSESDIKDYLTKQMFQKISSSTLKSDASPGALNESHDLSGIQNADFAIKQTSTPVNLSKELLKSHEKSSDMPSAIESEKGSKDFFSLPEHSP